MRSVYPKCACTARIRDPAMIRVLLTALAMITACESHTLVVTECGDYDSCDAVCLARGYAECMPGVSTAIDRLPLWTKGCATQPNTSPCSFKAQTNREGGFV